MQTWHGPPWEPRTPRNPERFLGTLTPLRPVVRKQPLWLMVLLVSLSLFQSRAAGAATVIIVGPVNGPPVMVETMVRLKGELTSAGFDTQIVDAPPVAANSDGGSRAALEQMASRRAA